MRPARRNGAVVPGQGRRRCCSLLGRRPDGFTVEGARWGRPVSFTWEDGRLSGDPAGVFDLQGYLERGQRVSATPTGPTFTAALELGYVAMVMILATLDTGATVAGDVPEIPPHSWRSRRAPSPGPSDESWP
jgi:hypothetical protein